MNLNGVLFLCLYWNVRAMFLTSSVILYSTHECLNGAALLNFHKSCCILCFFVLLSLVFVCWPFSHIYLLLVLLLFYKNVISFIFIIGLSSTVKIFAEDRMNFRFRWKLKHVFFRLWFSFRMNLKEMSKIWNCID